MKIKDITEGNKIKWNVMWSLNKSNAQPHDKRVVASSIITAKNPGLAKKKALKLIKAGKLHGKSLTHYTLMGFTELEILKVSRLK